MSRTPFIITDIIVAPIVIDKLYENMSLYQQLFVNGKAYKTFEELYKDLYKYDSRNNSKDQNQFFYNRLIKILIENKLFATPSDEFNQFISNRPYTKFVKGMLEAPNPPITPLDMTPYEAFEETPILDDATIAALEQRYMDLEGGKRRKTRGRRRNKKTRKYKR